MAAFVGIRSEAFVALRPADKPGDPVTSIGVTVPALDDAPSSIFDRWFSDDRGAGFGIVPVADLRLIGYDEDGKLFDVVRSVGVTSVRYSMIITLVSLFVIAVALRWAVGGAAPAPRAGVAHRLLNFIRDIFNVGWVLLVIRGNDGRASLSAFQVLEPVRNSVCGA